MISLIKELNSCELQMIKARLAYQTAKEELSQAVYAHSQAECAVNLCADQPRVHRLGACTIRREQALLDAYSTSTEYIQAMERYFRLLSAKDLAEESRV